MRTHALSILVMALASCTASGGPAQPPPVQPAPTVAQSGPLSQLQSTAAPGGPTIRATYAQAAKHVVQIGCRHGLVISQGSGFVHKSGFVVTAAHVIAGCTAPDIQMLVNGWSVTTNSPSHKVVGVAAIVAMDDLRDIALLKPSAALEPGLSIIHPTADVQLGDTVEFIGYPGGYQGLVPMLGVGYLAAIGPYPTIKPGVSANRAFVNGAFNHGNSGGPVLDLQTQTVTGLVHAKVVPLPPEVESALTALKNQTSGFQYNATVGGKQTTVTEAQVVEGVLEHYAGQIQLVVGVMVLPNDLRSFLESQKITP